MFIEFIRESKDADRGLMRHGVHVYVRKDTLELQFETIDLQHGPRIYSTQLIPIKVLSNYDKISIAAIRLIQEAMVQAEEITVHGKLKDL